LADTRLIHDSAFAAATELTERMEGLGPDERKEFHEEAYRVIKTSIEFYELKKAHEDSRIGRRRRDEKSGP
jgi:hypothetical protein